MQASLAISRTLSRWPALGGRPVLDLAGRRLGHVELAALDRGRRLAFVVVGSVRAKSGSDRIAGRDRFILPGRTLLVSNRRDGPCVRLLIPRTRLESAPTMAGYRWPDLVHHGWIRALDSPAARASPSQAKAKTQAKTKTRGPARDAAGNGAKAKACL
ncbi:MAG: hypothetical protein KY476_05665 [Planctomycetes bacterium]|nr:hypothetical protein [Planctomycetota bacterium]